MPRGRGRGGGHLLGRGAASDTPDNVVDPMASQPQEDDAYNNSGQADSSSPFRDVFTPRAIPMSEYDTGPAGTRDRPVPESTTTSTNPPAYGQWSGGYRGGHHGRGLGGRGGGGRGGWSSSGPSTHQSPPHHHHNYQQASSAASGQCPYRQSLQHQQHRSQFFQPTTQCPYHQQSGRQQQPASLLALGSNLAYSRNPPSHEPHHGYAGFDGGSPHTYLHSHPQPSFGQWAPQARGGYRGHRGRGLGGWSSSPAHGHFTTPNTAVNGLSPTSAVLVVPAGTSVQLMHDPDIHTLTRAMHDHLSSGLYGPPDAPPAASHYRPVPAAVDWATSLLPAEVAAATPAAAEPEPFIFFERYASAEEEERAQLQLQRSDLQRRRREAMRDELMWQMAQMARMAGGGDADDDDNDDEDGDSEFTIDEHENVVREAVGEEPPEEDAATKAARLQQEHEEDNQPDSLSMRYSRACGVCFTANPRRRANLVRCGHLLCMPCAEQLEKISRTRVNCPFCRKKTAYVRIFEELEAATGDGASAAAEEEDADLAAAMAASLAELMMPEGEAAAQDSAGPEAEEVSDAPAIGTDSGAGSSRGSGSEDGVASVIATSTRGMKGGAAAALEQEGAVVEEDGEVWEEPATVEPPWQVVRRH
ncbi:hypothetical protein PENTCL1PPCAC_24528 [Pristionchus entomophagus]|uniref:RING-type domain-containing protein n=1 Tax=Pristionchus entomophagus TaxID=358040 RepID=A0AAV5U7G3_9BILA|nr:hypothetical protein PENTCL1PPCAC_24528 [Pristionchus entomophagus]